MMTLTVVPIVAWAVHGTVISVPDILGVLCLPLGASIVAAGVAFGVRFFYGAFLSPLPRLLLEGTVLLISYVAVLLLALAGTRSTRKSFVVKWPRRLKTNPG
jgi:hypothetical protein